MMASRGHPGDQRERTKGCTVNNGMNLSRRSLRSLDH